MIKLAAVPPSLTALLTAAAQLPPYPVSGGASTAPIPDARGEGDER
jgi:hypothetical protein